MSEMYENSVAANGAAEQPKKGKKKGLIIAIAAVAAVAVIASVVAGILLSTPTALIARGAANTAKAMQKTEMTKLLTKAATGGSVELALGLEDLTEQALGTGVDGRVSLKFYGSKEMNSASSIALELGGETFVDLNVFASPEELILTSDAMLDDDAYGICFEDAADNFRNSVFGPGGEFDLGIGDIDMFVDLMEINKEMTAKLAELAPEFADALMDSLKEHGEISKENDELEFGEKSVKVTAVEIVLDDDALKDVISDMLDYMRDSDKVEEYLKLYAEYYASYEKISALAEYLNSQYYYEYYYDIYSFEEYCECFGIGAEIDIDDIYDMLDEIEDNLEYLEIDKLSLVCYITKSRTQMVGVELKVKAYDETMTYTVLAGPRIDKLTELRVSFDDGYSATELVYEVETDDKSEYAATLSVKEDDEEIILSGEIEWDKKNGEFELLLEDDGGDMLKVYGELTMDDESAEFNLEQVASYGETVELDLTVSLNASDKMPSAPGDYEDILELTSEEFEELGADIGARMMQKVTSLDEDILEVLEYLLYYM